MKVRFCYLQAWDANVLPLYFSHRRDSCASFSPWHSLQSLCLCFFQLLLLQLGRIALWSLFLNGPHQPEWESVGESPAPYLGPLRINGQPAGYLLGIYVTVPAIVRSWLACRRADPFALSAGRSESFPQSCEALQEELPSALPKSPPCHSAQWGVFHWEKQGKCVALFLQLLLVERDFHDWWARGDSPSFAFRVRNSGVRGRQSERLKVGGEKQQWGQGN